MTTERRPSNPLQSFHDRLHLLNVASDLIADKVRSVKETQKSHPASSDAIKKALETGDQKGQHKADVLWVNALSKRGFPGPLIEELWEIRNKTAIELDSDPSQEK